MDSRLQAKYEKLMGILESLDGIAVAFSGGVDSVFLLIAAKKAMGEKVIALTVNTPYIPDWEIKEASEIAEKNQIEHHIIEVPVPEQILNNPADRCYLCKTYLFTMLKGVAQKHGYYQLADGTNADDTKEHRPGMKALRELRVLSPLLESGFTKEDIRKASKEMGLYTWEKPAYACLLTRLPYDTRINGAVLRRIERAETYLIEIGIKAVRVRTHENLARIETESRYIEMIFREGLFGKISRQLKRFGFSYVTLDMEGYRTGGIEDLFKDMGNDRKE